VGTGKVEARFQKSDLGSQLAPQQLHHQPDRLLIATIPAPLSVLRRLHQSGFHQDRHVMRNRWLGKMDALLDIAAAETRSLHVLRSGGRSSLFQNQQDAATRGVCDGVKSTVERSH
jgi:hypothetical protein